MGKLRLSVAVGDYDRMRPLVDGAGGIDAVDPQFMLLEPEEIFFRAFRHTSVYVRTDRIRAPEALKGKRVGVPEYQLTANVWVRMMLEGDHGVRPSDVT